MFPDMQRKRVTGSAQAGPGNLQTQTLMGNGAFTLGDSQSQGLIIFGKCPEVRFSEGGMGGREESRPW